MWKNFDWFKDADTVAKCLTEGKLWAIILIKIFMRGMLQRSVLGTVLGCYTLRCTYVRCKPIFLMKMELGIQGRNCSWEFLYLLEDIKSIIFQMEWHWVYVSTTSRQTSCSGVGDQHIMGSTVSFCAFVWIYSLQSFFLSVLFVFFSLSLLWYNFTLFSWFDIILGYCLFLVKAIIV